MRLVKNLFVRNFGSQPGLAVLLLFGAGASLAHGQVSRTDQVSEQAAMTFKDLDGAEHTLPCLAGRRGLVLVFINTECPIANSYQPMLRRLRDEFADQQFDFAMVHSDPELQAATAREHQQAYEIAWPIALDPGNRIARRVKAKVTPEAIVLDAKGQVLYRGRIDDRYQDYGRKRPAPTTQDLRRALIAISKNVMPVPSETQAIGCVIRYAD